MFEKSSNGHPLYFALIKWVLIGLVFFIILFFMRQHITRFLTYPAPPVTVPSPPPEPYEEIYLSLKNQQTVSCWLYKNPIENTKIIVLMFHGNGENLETMRMGGLLNSFQNLDIHFLAVDYPGYGNSSGKTSEKANLEAADAAFKWIKEEFPDNSVIIFGWSLGAAVAIQAAAKHPGETDALIAISPWSSLKNVATAHYPQFLVNTLLNEKYDSIEAAKNITSPTLVVHGERDNIIPVEQGKRVADAIPGKSKWISIANAGHNDIFSSEAVWDEIKTFLKKLIHRRA